jgi:hypothetical protein
MTAVCGGGASIPKPDQPLWPVLLQGALGAIIGARNPRLGLLVGFLPTWSDFLPDFCSFDPPDFPEWTSEDLASLVSFTGGDPLPALNQKLLDTVRHLAWFEFCTCAVGAAPIAPALPAPTNVPEYVGGPCLTVQRTYQVDILGPGDPDTVPTDMTSILPATETMTFDPGGGLNPIYLQRRDPNWSAITATSTFVPDSSGTTQNTLIELHVYQDPPSTATVLNPFDLEVGNEASAPGNQPTDTATWTWNDAYPWYSILGYGASSTSAEPRTTLKLDMACFGGTQSTCCPPDQSIVQKLDRMSAQLADLLAAGSSSAYTDLEVGVVMELFEVTPNVGVDPYAWPDYLWGAGRVRFWDGEGWTSAIRLDAEQSWIPVPLGALKFSWYVGPVFCRYRMRG